MDARWTSDADLARSCRRGDPAAWRALVTRFTPLAWRVSVRVLRNPVDAEDACQETFARVHRSFDSYDPTRPLGPWIGRIAYHAALKRLARVTAEGTSANLDDLAELPDAYLPRPDAAAEDSESRRAVDAAMQALPAQDRAIVTMYYSEGWPVAEIAEATDMAANTVKVRLFRARQRLKAGLARLGLGPEEG